MIAHTEQPGPAGTRGSCGKSDFRSSFNMKQKIERSPVTHCSLLEKEESHCVSYHVKTYKTRSAVIPQPFCLTFFSLFCHFISIKAAESSTYATHFIMLQEGKVHPKSLHSFSSILLQLHSCPRAWWSWAASWCHSVHYLAFTTLLPLIGKTERAHFIAE